MKQRLVEYTLRQIRKKRQEINVPLIKNDDQELLGIRLAQEMISGSDKRIINNPRRKVIADRIRQNGKTPYWFLASGIMEGNIGATDLSLGTFPASFGFDVKAILEYNYMVPLELATDDVFEQNRVAQEFQFLLPFQHFMSQHFREGTEFEIIGKGRGKLTATAGWDYQTGIMNATVGLGGTVESDQVFALCVIRLDKDLVSVKIDKGIKRQTTVEAAISVNINSNRLKPIIDPVLESIDNSLADVNSFLKEVPCLEEFQGLGKMIEAKGLEPVLQAVQAFNIFHLSAESSSTEQRQSVTAFTFSINTKTAFDAYYRLLKLDDKLAMRYATEDPGKFGVSVAVSSFMQSAQSSGLTAEISSKHLLLLQAIYLEQERSHLENQVLNIERKNLLKNSRDIIISREEEVIWEDVLLQKFTTDTDPPKLDKTYQFAHMAYSNKDKVTTREEVEAFLLFSKWLGCYSGKTILPHGDLKFWKMLLGIEQKSERKVSVYYSNKAISQLTTVNNKAFWQAFVNVRNHFDPAKNGQSILPLNSKSVRKKYFDNERALDILTAQGYDKSFKLKKKEYEDYPGEYKKEYKRKLRDDAKEFLLGEKLRTILTNKDKSDEHQGDVWESFIDVKNDKTLFTSLGKKFKYDFFLPVALCAALCDRKEVVVSNIEFKNERIHLKCSSVHEMKIPEDVVFPEDDYMINVKTNTRKT